MIFDQGLPGGRSESLSGGRVSVVFAPTGRKADGVLIEHIRRSRNPGGLIVVTSDREVIAEAQRQDARVVRSEEFAGELEPTPAPQAGAKEDVQLSPDEVEEWLELFENG